MITPTYFGIASLALVVIGMAGCEENKPAAKPVATPAAPTTPAAPPAGKAAAPAAAPAASPAAAGAVGPVVVAGLKFAVPQGWKQVPPANSMRLAELSVPDASGDAAKACTIAFSTAGGTVASNTDRWAGQFKDPAGKPIKVDVVTREVAGLKVHTVELEGTYAGMGDGAPRLGSMMRASIVELPGESVFIKMTGPIEQMKAAGSTFTAMVDGMTK